MYKSLDEWIDGEKESNYEVLSDLWKLTDNLGDDNDQDDQDIINHIKEKLNYAAQLIAFTDSVKNKEHMYLLREEIRQRIKEINILFIIR